MEIKAETNLVLEELIRNLAVGMQWVILSHKENLPTRSKKHNYPALLWACAPLHDDFPRNWNRERCCCNALLEKLTISFQDMYVLKLVKFWDSEDPALFTDRRFTAAGLAAIWASIDSAFRHWDTFIYPKNKKGNPKGRRDETPHRGDNSRPTDRKMTKASDFVRREFNRYKKLKPRNDFHWEKTPRKQMPEPPY